MKLFRTLMSKYKLQINYLIFGAVTTIVNIISYFLFYNILKIPNVPSTFVAWLVSVITAYITNKIWVFESKSFELNTLTKEISSFFGCRILTGILDILIMWISVDMLSVNSTLMKIISNIIVIILNYIASKLLIFKTKR